MNVRSVLILILIAAAQCRGQETPAWSIHFQATSIGQWHDSFASLYEGANSLPSHPERRVSLTGTIFIDYRLNSHWDFVANPEIAGGKGFGQVTGIAGFTNGEIPRVASATPALYPARAFVRYTAPLGGEEVEPIEDGPNQTAASLPVNRTTTIAGRFALTDFFDNNTYSHDPRTQFMNWSLMYNGAWDYPADVRGYTIGIYQELHTRTWALRAAMAMEPTVANGPTLDTRVGRNSGQVVEFERDLKPFSKPAAVRLLGFLNREDAGTYREAMQTAGTPDLGPTRRNGTIKYGFGLNVEQALSTDAGVFARYGWNDGKTETWAFTEIDRSLSAGFTLRGRAWRRPADVIGIGAVQNYISGDHRTFLAAGGYGFIIGDGRLNYHPEQILESYYAFHVTKQWTVTADYQHINNPAYNRDRGPVEVASLRLHWER